MDNVNQMILLGTGTSTGVPILGCSCPVCTSEEEKDNRLRSSVLFKIDGDNILVDFGPDIRRQLLREKISHLEACILTHDHADHSHGVDDLRPFTFFQNKSIPIFTHRDAINTITRKFPYIFDQENFFKDKKKLGGGLPHLTLNDAMDLGKESAKGFIEIEILGNKFEFFLNPHGHTETLGILYRKVCYIIDCNSIPETTIQELAKKNLDLLVIDSVRREPHSTHLHLAKSMEYAKQINAKETRLTHLSHDFQHQEFAQELLETYGKGVQPAFDGEIFKI